MDSCNCCDDFNRNQGQKSEESFGNKVRYQSEVKPGSRNGLPQNESCEPFTPILMNRMVEDSRQKKTTCSALTKSRNGANMVVAMPCAKFTPPSEEESYYKRKDKLMKYRAMSNEEYEAAPCTDCGYKEVRRIREEKPAQDGMTSKDKCCDSPRCKGKSEKCDEFGKENVGGERGMNYPVESGTRKEQDYQREPFSDKNRERSRQNNEMRREQTTAQDDKYAYREQDETPRCKERRLQYQESCEEKPERKTRCPKNGCESPRCSDCGKRKIRKYQGDDLRKEETGRDGERAETPWRKGRRGEEEIKPGSRNGLTGEEAQVDFEYPPKKDRRREMTATKETEYIICVDKDEMEPSPKQSPEDKRARQDGNSPQQGDGLREGDKMTVCVPCPCRGYCATAEMSINVGKI